MLTNWQVFFFKVIIHIADRNVGKQVLFIDENNRTSLSTDTLNALENILDSSKNSLS